MSHTPNRPAYFVFRNNPSWHELYARQLEEGCPNLDLCQELTRFPPRIDNFDWSHVDFGCSSAAEQMSA
ncbi:hypothetical protein D918_08029 [Trichuris suis]|nr:hypothetical protein D918_08029 [Trichuris suis]